ncbi:hypothetical protein CYMTET_27258 [Cymbomonas tetramitiformis]|uniref:Uncharacterized protein n=1 Tax=Cymbomonas tetramitiformis TaxID=36881 RepID=A0AAE0KX62_9CHLO|nr:hypothetical protein CYMTET_27258 [Cymbomonas tetramitiformis]
MEIKQGRRMESPTLWASASVDSFLPCYLSSRFGIFPSDDSDVFYTLKSKTLKHLSLSATKGFLLPRHQQLPLLQELRIVDIDDQIVPLPHPSRLPFGNALQRVDMNMTPTALSVLAANCPRLLELKCDLLPTARGDNGYNSGIGIDLRMPTLAIDQAEFTCLETLIMRGSKPRNFCLQLPNLRSAEVTDTKWLDSASITDLRELAWLKLRYGYGGAEAELREVDIIKQHASTLENMDLCGLRLQTISTPKPMKVSFTTPAVMIAVKWACTHDSEMLWRDLNMMECEGLRLARVK